jgi:two-component system sensor histidine kinase HydH
LTKDNQRAHSRASRWPDTLAGRLAAALVVFVLLATAGVLGVEYVRGRETLLRESQNRLQARDRLAADRLERALGDRLRLVEAWPGLGAAQDIAVDDVDKRLAASLSQLAGSFQGQDLALAVDTGGRVVAASDPAWIGRTTGGSGWLPLLRQSEGRAARLHVLRQEAQPGVLASSPVFGPRGDRLGWIVLLTPWSELLNEVAPDDRTGLSVHTAEGRLVVGDMPEADTPVLTARETMRELGGVQFRTETTEPVSEALRPLRTASVQLFVLALVFLAVALPAVVLYARSTTRELRRLTDAARDVRREDVSDFHQVSDAAPREVRVLSGALETMLSRLEASRHELARQESLAAMGMMAAGLAHEIRTPLSIVRGSAEMLGRNAAAGSREEELTTFILSETGRLSRLVNDLLSFARPREPERAPADLADIADQVSSAMGGEFEANDVALETDLAAAPVNGDADQLYQVVLNLLANARKASPAGSRVHLTCAVQAGSAVLQIRDHGAGIRPERLAEVWTPFFTTGGGGTGLGLPIVRRIVEAHGGTVTLESETDEGTTATVRLPARSDP